MAAESFQRRDAAPTIRCGALSGLDGFLRRSGVQTPALCERAGVDPLALGDPDSRMEVRSYVALLESAARQSHDDSLGLRLGYQQPLTTVGVLSSMYLQACDVGAAIQCGIDHLPLHQEGARLKLSLEGPHAVLSYSVRDPGLLDYRQDAELSVAKMLRFARAIAGTSDWSPVAVYFEHPAPRDTSEHRKLFGAPVYFSQACNGIVFPKELLNHRISGGHSGVAPAPVDPVAQQAGCTQLDLAGELRLHIVQALRQGHISIDDCAAAFGLGTRTLQRRLAAAGVVFEELVESTRFELARHYLKQAHLSLTEIGYLLGYAELSTFSRAFRRWSGRSPRAFRSKP